EPSEPIADAGKPDGVRIVHRSATPDRKAVAVDPDHVDIARVQRDPLLEDARAFVDHRVDQPLDDLLPADRAPLDTEPVSRPRVSASGAASTTVTGMPALAKHMAMPPPMVPAPITAARLISRGSTSFETPGTLAASRSAKKMWRWALDCSSAISSVNVARSRV